MVCTMCIPHLQLKCPRCRATVVMFIQTFAWSAW
jgi:phage FluMu protein Com